MLARQHTDKRSRLDIRTAAGYAVIIAVWLIMAV